MIRREIVKRAPFIAVALGMLPATVAAAPNKACLETCQHSRQCASGLCCAGQCLCCGRKRKRVCVNGGGFCCRRGNCDRKI